MFNFTDKFFHFRGRIMSSFPVYGLKAEYYIYPTAYLLSTYLSKYITTTIQLSDGARHPANLYHPGAKGTCEKIPGATWAGKI